MSALSANLSLPPVEQVSYVVGDLEATMAFYAPFFGPFSREPYEKVTGALYRGTPQDCELHIAYGKSGDLEIEFIQPVSGTGPHQEFLDQGREGIHHVRFRVEDCDAVITRLAPHGYGPIWYHDLGFGKFAYLEHESQNGVLLELLEMDDRDRPSEWETQ